jgi:hypothetical protein
MLPLQPLAGTGLYAPFIDWAAPPTPVIIPPLKIKAAPRRNLVVKTEPRPLMIKSEPVEDRVQSRKRSGTVSVLRDIAPKKIKADPENPPMAEVDVRPLPSMNTETVRGELTDLQAKINHLQPQLERARRKSGKTTEQLTREKKLTSQLIAHYERKKELMEMIPAVSAPAHPFAGPSFQNSFVGGFAQPMQPLAFVQPHAPSVPVASGSTLSLNPFKDEPMDADSDGDDVALPPTSDMDYLHPFEDEKDPMLVDGTDLSMDPYHFNIAKADEWGPFYSPTTLAR